MNKISKLIAQKGGYETVLNELEKLSGSELNSLLLELFGKRSKKISPAELLRQFEKNRFAAPSTVHPIAFKELELRCLKLAESKNFNPIILSPLTPLGTCSVVGFVDQNNVVSASRGTEIVSDATNVFALLIVGEYRKKRNKSIIKYATTQRNVRSQGISNPGFTPHFGLFCLASGGLDTGNFSFKIENLLEHINVHLSLLSDEFAKDKLFIKFLLKDNNESFHRTLEEHSRELNNSIRIKIERQSNPGNYYKLVQFKFFLEHEGKEINLSDGGFVDWTQKLIQNKKHRLLISGVGTELIYKIKHDQI